MSKKTFSLICGTYGRFNEIEYLLESLNRQTFKDFEVIIVDQNDTINLKIIIDKFSDLDIIHIKTDQKGLSKARNRGIKIAKGDILAFPDDDCIYSTNILQEITSLFSDRENKIISAKTTEDISKTKDIISLHVKELSKFDIFSNNYFISYCIFINNQKGLFFDEDLGVGSLYPSTEESEYILSSVLNNNSKLYFIDNLYIYHPFKDDIPKRNYDYGIGYGAFIKKNISKHYIFTYYLLRTIIKKILKIFFYSLKNRKIVESNINYLKGVIKGMKLYK